MLVALLAVCYMHCTAQCFLPERVLKVLHTWRLLSTVIIASHIASNRKTCLLNVSISIVAANITALDVAGQVCFCLLLGAYICQGPGRNRWP